MGADLHIHVVGGNSSDRIADVEAYLRHEFWSSDIGAGYSMYLLDGKWLRLDSVPDDRLDDIEDTHEIPVQYDDGFVSSTPSVFVGEVSWLKAALFCDAETFIPDAVGKVSEILSREMLPLISDELIAEIAKAMTLPNQTAKEGGVYLGAGYTVAAANDVVCFLERHKGKRAFAISW